MIVAPVKQKHIILLNDFYKFYAVVISNCSKQRQNISIFLTLGFTTVFEKLNICS